MTTYPLRRLRLRLGDEHRETVEIGLQPFDLGGERYLPVPAQASATFEAQRATGGDVYRLVFDSRLHGALARAAISSTQRNPALWRVRAYSFPGCRGRR